jgi:transcriptional regulator with XRE-family HTH domain
MHTNISRSVRFMRLRKGWPQRVLGRIAGVSREMVSRVERGDVSGMTLGSIEQVAQALGASVSLQLRWHGEQLDRLMDAAHAAIQQSVAELLTGLGWIVRVEVSFNRYGERGRVDIVAFHPALRILLIIEVKSALGDLQETLGRLDVKVRLARQIARDLDWTDVAAVIPVLVIGDSRVARRTVAAHAALFARFSLRGRLALAWLRQPTSAPPGLLWFANRPDSHQATIQRGPRAPRRPDSQAA